MFNNILVVDDSRTNIYIITSFLENSYNIFPASNGEEALEIIAKQNINLVLLDIVMPQMDGFEVCTKLKADKKTKHIPVIFITANTDDNNIEQAYTVGGVDYITKPFRKKSCYTE